MGYYWAVIRFIGRVVFAALLLRAAWCGWLRCLNMFWSLNMSLWLIALARSKDGHGHTGRFCRRPRFASITARLVGRHAQSIIMCNLESFSAGFSIVWPEETLAQEQEWLSAYQDVIAISDDRSWSGEVVVMKVT
jgi:hypothetical protein